MVVEAATGDFPPQIQPTRDTPTMTLEEDDFRVFRELCDAFNGLEKSHLDDPFTAKPFRYLHEDVELQDYPVIPGATWHVGHPGALQWTMNLWESFGDFQLEPREFIRTGRGRFVCVTGTVGQGRRSGLQLSMTAYAVVTIEEGKVRRIGITTDRHEALEAAVLREDEVEITLPREEESL
jgi:ketosteroid isomerase-like protein